jgi:thioredoxin reductase (NADPH)
MRDVVIIGAGPVGLACGIEARRRDLDALIIEKGALVNSFMNYPTKLEFFSTPELLEIGGHPFSTNGYKPVREEAIDYYRRVALAEELETNLYETVTALRGADGRFEVQTDKGSYPCRKVVGATGFFDVPNRMHVPGEDLDKVTHYYREPYPYARQEVAALGQLALKVVLIDRMKGPPMLS